MCVQVTFRGGRERSQGIWETGARPHFDRDNRMNDHQIGPHESARANVDGNGPRNWRRAKETRDARECLKLQNTLPQSITPIKRSLAGTPTIWESNASE